MHCSRQPALHREPLHMPLRCAELQGCPSVCLRLLAVVQCCVYVRQSVVVLVKLAVWSVAVESITSPGFPLHTSSVH